MSNDQERIDREVNMFGMTSEDIKSIFGGSIPSMASKILSILSDAQESQEMGLKELSRKKINLAKFLVMEIEDKFYISAKEGL